MSNPNLVFDHVHVIAEKPHETAQWYVDKLGAVIKADTIARGAPQIFVELGAIEGRHRRYQALFHRGA